MNDVRNAGSGGRIKRWLALVGLVMIVLFALPAVAETDGAAPVSRGMMGLRVQVDPTGSPEEFSQSLRIVLGLTALSLAPSAIIMMTSFIRILIVLGLLRQAMGLQQAPPGQVLAAMALFLTIFIMMPVWHDINRDAIEPYSAQTITSTEAWERGLQPLKQFMARQTGDRELGMFLEMAREQPPERPEMAPLQVLVPAFMISELKTAFQMGFMIYLPFLVIDLVIASTLMALGMMMLPPIMISLPIKLLFFVLADGWVLVMRGIVSSFIV